MAQNGNSGRDRTGGGALESLRDMAAANPAAQRLMTEAEEYLRSSGQRLVESLVDRFESGGEAGSAGGAAAKTAVSQLQRGGSPVGAAGKALGTGAKEVVKSVFGKGAGSKKASLFAEALDVGVPVSTAYNQWTQFQEFARFMKGIEGVEQQDEVETTWRVKIGPSRRTWKGSIREQIPDRRIAWTSNGSKGSTQGVITFHPLADDLTRMLVSIEYYPHGIVEHVGNLFRWQGRRVHLDLMNFRRFVMSQGEATGEWRGEIRDGKVVNRGERQGRNHRPAPSEGSDERSANSRAAAPRDRQERTPVGASSSRAAGHSESAPDQGGGDGHHRRTSGRAGQSGNNRSR